MSLKLRKTLRKLPAPRRLRPSGVPGSVTATKFSPALSPLTALTLLVEIVVEGEGLRGRPRLARHDKEGFLQVDPLLEGRNRHRVCRIEHGQGKPARRRARTYRRNTSGARLLPPIPMWTT